jgi:hypothetical protein
MFEKRKRDDCLEINNFPLSHHNRRRTYISNIVSQDHNIKGGDGIPTSSIVLCFVHHTAMTNFYSMTTAEVLAANDGMMLTRTSSATQVDQDDDVAAVATDAAAAGTEGRDDGGLESTDNGKMVESDAAGSRTRGGCCEWIKFQGVAKAKGFACVSRVFCNRSA